MKGNFCEADVGIKSDLQAPEFTAALDLDYMFSLLHLKIFFLKLLGKL